MLIDSIKPAFKREQSDACIDSAEHEQARPEVKPISTAPLADFVDVADLSGQNVVDMLSSGWKDYEDATQHRSAIDEQADCIVMG